MSKKNRISLLDKLRAEDEALWSRIVTSRFKAVDTAEVYHAVFKGTRKYLKENDVSMSQLDTLMAIFRLSLENPYLHRSDLGSPRMGTLAALIERGWITSTGKSDNRRKLYRLTRKGHDEVMKIHRQWSEHLQAFQRKYVEGHFWLSKSATRAYCPHCGCQKITLDKNTVYIDTAGVKGGNPPKCLRKK